MSEGLRILTELADEVAPKTPLEAQLRSYLPVGGIELEGVTVEEVLEALDNGQHVRWKDLSYRFNETLFYFTARINKEDPKPDDVIPVVTACFVIAGGIKHGFGTGLQLGNMLGAISTIRHELAEQMMLRIVRYLIDVIAEKPPSA